VNTSQAASIRRFAAAVALWGAAFALMFLAGCTAPRANPAAPKGKAGALLPVFTDVTSAAGIHFVHDNGRSGKKYLPETLGSGCAFFDADGDGWLDILFVNGRDWNAGGRKSLQALYRNRQDGTFEDVTAGSGLDVELSGFGVAIGDYDNDGKDDVYLTALEGDRLFHNEGGGHFRDVTERSGIRNARFGTSAAWFDYDRDGKLDLFVANYVDWSVASDVWCSLDGVTKSYCTPEKYQGSGSRLFHNLGGGRFEDVTEKAGALDPTGKSLGVAVLDYDGDGWPDLFVANDTEPNRLYRNHRDGTFVEEGMTAGVAYGEDGAARGAMGVDAADLERSGRESVVVGNFSNQMLALYGAEKSESRDSPAIFVDRAPGTVVGRASQLDLTFGVFFFDYDNDGWLDIFAANGHLEEAIETVQPTIRFRQPPRLFRGRGGDMNSFADVTVSSGPDLSRALVARGAACGDFDRDGDLDVLVTTNDGAPHLFRNDGGNRNHWISVKTAGTVSNRDGIGAVVRVSSAQGTQARRVHSGSSYCSESDHVLMFGLGQDEKVTGLVVSWPGGAEERFAAPAIDRLVTVEEGKGIGSGILRP